MSSLQERLLAGGWIPDWIIRWYIRRGLQQRLEEFNFPAVDVHNASDYDDRQVQRMRDSSRLAVHTAEANQQHYEVPTELFQLTLGPALKYSCCFYPQLEQNLVAGSKAGLLKRTTARTLWHVRNAFALVSSPFRVLAWLGGFRLPQFLEGNNTHAARFPGAGSTSLATAESDCFDLYVARAELHALTSGAQVLDLGCGWGSFTLTMAARFPHLQFTAVSNSATQREYIVAEAKRRGLPNVVAVITCDVNALDFPADSFDRICSVEMFEHVRNYESLFRRIGKWLKPTGKLFVHIFAHRSHPYFFDEGWMAENFFTGGTMPSINLLPRLCGAGGLIVERLNVVNGMHYARTCEGWLDRLDESYRSKAVVQPLVQDPTSEAVTKNVSVQAALERCYGKDKAKLWLANWRLFYLACSEMFAFNQGTEWVVVHYLFCRSAEDEKKPAS